VGVRRAPAGRSAGAAIYHGLIDGVEITGASKMHELIKAGAATLSF
jgi:hypothetical protein